MCVLEFDNDFIRVFNFNQCSKECYIDWLVNCVHVYIHSALHEMPVTNNFQGKRRGRTDTTRDRQRDRQKEAIFDRT